MPYRYLRRRLTDLVLTLFGIAVVVFVALRLLPGNQITGQLGLAASNLTPAQQASLRAYYGLNKPLAVQFIDWLGNVLHGNLGMTVASGDSVASLIGQALPVTIELAFLASVIGIAIGVPLGIFSAARARTAADGASQAVGLLGLGIPDFVLASMLVWIMSAGFHYFPSAGRYIQITQSPVVNLQQQIYPALVLGVALAANIMRTTRSAYLEQASQDFVRTARGKGLTAKAVRRRHILRNASIPIVTITGIQLGYLLGGTIVVEQVFGLPGLGSLLLTGIQQREYALVQGVVIVITGMFVLVNVAADIVYTWIDPRVKLA